MFKKSDIASAVEASFYLILLKTLAAPTPRGNILTMYFYNYHSLALIYCFIIYSYISKLFIKMFPIC